MFLAVRSRSAVKTVALLRTFQVLGLPDSRVGAPLVRDYAEELTPPEEFARAREAALLRRQFSAPGAGRPTKRDRRSMEAFRRLSEGRDVSAVDPSPGD